MAQHSYTFGRFVFDTQRRALTSRGSTVAIGQKCLAITECHLGLHFIIAKFCITVSRRDTLSNGTITKIPFNFCVLGIYGATRPENMLCVKFLDIA